MHSGILREGSWAQGAPPPPLQKKRLPVFTWDKIWSKSLVSIDEVVHWHALVRITIEIVAPCVQFENCSQKWLKIKLSQIF